MEKNSPLSIHISIAGRSYPLTIPRQKEESLRKIAKDIEAHISNLKENYAVKDSQDLLAMTLLEYASKLQEQDADEADKASAEALQELDALLDDLVS